MTEAAKRIAGNLQQAGQPEEQEQAQALFESGARVYYYTESLLEYIKLQTRNQHIITKSLHLRDLVVEKISVFHSIAHAQGSKILNDDPEQAPGHTGIGLLIVRSLLANIHERLFVERAEQRGTIVQVIISR